MYTWRGILLLALCAGAALTIAVVMASKHLRSRPEGGRRPYLVGAAIAVVVAIVVGAHGAAELAWAPDLRGTVSQLVLKDDSYGTPYYHLEIEGDDGKSYSLLSNYMNYPYDFEQGKAYAFRVLWGAARGDLVAEARQTIL